MSHSQRLTFDFSLPAQDIIVPSHATYLVNEQPQTHLVAPVPRRAFPSSSNKSRSLPSSGATMSTAYALPQAIHDPSSITIPTYPNVFGSSHESHGIPSSTRKKRSVPDSPGDHDPYAAPFIREFLGEEKWCIFSARLARPTKVPVKTKSRASSSPKSFADEEDDPSGTYVIDFLVKNEIVKAVFRTLLPHPNSPQKESIHPFALAPKGYVILSRECVLGIVGWSHTQQSYWTRRIEGISVLETLDERLHVVANRFRRKLSEIGINSEPPARPTFSREGKSEDELKKLPPDLAAYESESEYETAVDDWIRQYVSGKGLDEWIKEVEARTGVSRYLRGIHSCWAPFGTKPDSDAVVKRRRKGRSSVYTRTFQAKSYVHDDALTPIPPAVSKFPTRRTTRLQPQVPSVSVTKHGQPPILALEIPADIPTTTSVEAADLNALIFSPLTPISASPPSSVPSPVTPADEPWYHSGSVYNGDLSTPQCVPWTDPYSTMDNGIYQPQGPTDSMWAHTAHNASFAPSPKRRRIDHDFSGYPTTDISGVEVLIVEFGYASTKLKTACFLPT
ncbi:hypothetical protein QCA50_003009 [Cerrena zonata]|uniref:Uncharacterized protein n=1 Tax=Cerrena zonata TaxID=2478898 RepID=A0AAW0GJB2_9APHY